MKINIQDFDATLEKVLDIWSQFLVYRLRLLTTKTYLNFVMFDLSIFTWFTANVQPGRQTNFKFSHGEEINIGT